MSVDLERAPRTPLGDYFRECAQRRRELAAATPEDPRHLRAAAALDALAATADDEVDAQGWFATHLLRHHVRDGAFAWPDGQSGRAVANFGFDAPVDGAAAHAEFLAELCDLASRDAASYITAHDRDFDRGDVGAIARRFGVGSDRVHDALDRARHQLLFQVGVPQWHVLTDGMRRALEGLDGTWVEPVTDAHRRDAERPVIVNNVGADDDVAARRVVGELVGIDPEALGVRRCPRVFPRTG